MVAVSRFDSHDLAEYALILSGKKCESEMPFEEGAPCLLSPHDNSFMKNRSVREYIKVGGLSV